MALWQRTDYDGRTLLRTAGSIMVHCDFHASRDIKVEMDKVSGHTFLQNEII